MGLAVFAGGVFGIALGSLGEIANKMLGEPIPANEIFVRVLVLSMIIFGSSGLWVGSGGEFD